MLTRSIKRRILTYTIALIIVGILYFFPNSKNNLEINHSINYKEGVTTPIFLLNKDSYVVRAVISKTSDDLISHAKDLIEALTIDGKRSEDIPEYLTPIIPKNTKLKSIDFKDGLLKLNFSEHFLNIDKDKEEKLIEALIYTLTENKEIKEIMIFINEKKLEYLPQSKITLPNTLTRDFGINKVYDITSIKDATKTTIYYIGKNNDYTYYIPITKIDNNKSNKVEIIIEELKSSPIYETNLMSYLASSVELLNYEILENQVNLTFNNEIFADFTEKNILEEVKYSISLSLEDTLRVNEVNFLVDGEVIETFKET